MKINEIIDKCGLRLLIFVAAYLALRHAELSVFTHLLSSVTVTLCAVALVEMILSGKQKPVDKECVSRTVASLALAGNEKFLSRLCAAAGGEMDGDGFVTEKKCFVSSRLYNPVNAEDTSVCFRKAVKAGCDKITIFAPLGSDISSRELINESPVQIKFIGAEKLYDTLKGLDMLPELSDKKKKKTFKELIKILLSKANARRFLITAAIILIFSFFVSFTVWYVVLAAVDIVLAAVCLSNVAERITV